MRIDWTELPEAVTKEITNRIGGSHVVPATSGNHAEIAAAVTGGQGTVVVKAGHSDLGVRSLRYELRASEAVDQPYSPAVRWHFEAAGWLVVGFEHCPGRHADLSPGSPDLDLLAGVLKLLSETPAPDQTWFTPEGRLGFAHPAIDGDTLVHTDLSSANLIVTDKGLRVVDWAFTTKAAPWVELALLTQWLIGAGHTPAQAENWLSQQPTWIATNPEIIDEFASRNAAKWAAKAQPGSPNWMHELAAWNLRWAAHRRGAALKD